MLENLLGGFVDKEQITKDTISLALIAVAKEYNLTHKELAFMIQPKDDEFNFKVYIVQLDNGAPKKLLREITVKEIVTPAE